MSAAFNKIKSKSKLKLILFWTLLSCSLVNCGVVIKRSQRVRSIIQINDSYIHPELTKGSLINKIKELCDKGVHLLVSDVVCAKQLAHLCNEPEILLRMIDASGKYSGMLLGSRYDLGNFDECVDIDHEYQDGRMMGKYCPYALVLPDLDTGYSNWTMTFKLAICIPDGCSFDMFIPFAAQLHLEDKIEEAASLCVTKETGRELTVGNIVAITGFCSWFGFIFLVTCYDVFLYYNTEKKCQHKHLSFSLVLNFKKLLWVAPKSSDRIEIFDGLRTISLTWIIAGHGFMAWETVPVMNGMFVSQYIEQYYTTYIYGAFFAVDTFFFISGFLVAFHYLRHNSYCVGKQILSLPKMYLHRYIRLTISTSLLIIFGIWIFPKIGNGPHWIPGVTAETKKCERNWLSFFLYYQNYNDPDEMCIRTTWYLSADMQMYILSPLVLIPLTLLVYKPGSFKVTAALLGILNLVATVAPMLHKLLTGYLNL